MIIPEVSKIVMFATVAFTLIVVPGPAVLFITAKSIENGKKSGFISVLGIGAGAMVHVCFAAFGLSAILLASATAFSIIKYLGAVYLIYLGIQKFILKPSDTLKKEPTTSGKKQLSVFYEGIIVNVLNPKTAIFFFALLPQFVSVELGGTSSQIIFLGLLFVSIAILSDSLYVIIADKAYAYLRNKSIFIRFHQYFIGTIYILLGLLTIGVQNPNNSNK